MYTYVRGGSMLSSAALIECGFFPSELVPPFNTKMLGPLVNHIVTNENSLTKGHSSSKPIQFSIPKLKKSRRQLCIPNPLHQILLSHTISQNWSVLSTHYAKSRLSLTTPIESTRSDRAVETKYPFNEITRQNILLSTASSYLVKTDISRYYNTIYTHSIPWAYHGKQFAKANRGVNHLGNLIDLLVRNTRDQQTMGIPVGPDTSLIISEIIGSAIDEKLQKDMPKLKGFRYIDDYYLYFDDLAEAQKVIYILSNTFSEFELEMNVEKTEQIELHQPVEPEWLSDIRLHSIQNKSEKDLISYFNKVFQFSEQYKQDFVIKYALRRIRTLKVEKNVWDIYEAFLLKSMLAESSVIPIVTDILVKYQNLGYTLNIPKIGETINLALKIHGNLSHTYEIIWLLWIAKTFNISIGDGQASLITNIDDPIVAIVFLDINNKGLVPKKVDFSVWKKHMQSSELYSEFWILTYEAYVKGWLPSKSGKDYISKDPFFGFLKSNNVSFYEDSITHEKYIESKINKQTSEAYVASTTTNNAIDIIPISNEDFEKFISENTPDQSFDGLNLTNYESFNNTQEKTNDDKLDLYDLFDIY